MSPATIGFPTPTYTIGFRTFCNSQCLIGAHGRKGEVEYNVTVEGYGICGGGLIGNPTHSPNICRYGVIKRTMLSLTGVIRLLWQIECAPKLDNNTSMGLFDSVHDAC
jgi:hypothetical protein